MWQQNQCPAYSKGLHPGSKVSVSQQLGQLCPAGMCIQTQVAGWGQSLYWDFCDSRIPDSEGQDPCMMFYLQTRSWSTQNLRPSGVPSGSKCLGLAVPVGPAARSSPTHYRCLAWKSP